MIIYIKNLKYWEFAIDNPAAWSYNQVPSFREELGETSDYERAVCHIDANYYYGQIEALYRPDVRGKAFVVGGDQESRKGIVLTKSPPAKKLGVRTGTSITEALGICPGLIVLPANYPLYLHFTNRMREIVLQHTDTIRPFGSDEMWAQLYGDREAVRKTVQNIRQALWKQLCLTVSIGVSDNLPYAKLASDAAPNNSVCEMWSDEREEKVYPLPVSELLYVGYATTKKFNMYGINTIGDLANSDPKYICGILRCKTGESLWAMAGGQDKTPVAHLESVEDVKSIGNSNTMPRDLVNEDDVRAAFLMLGDSVAQRMRENGFQATTLQISVRDNDLFYFQRQMKLPRPTNLTAELVPAAMQLFRQQYSWFKPIRSLGLRGADLVADNAVYQLSAFFDEKKHERTQKLERCADRVREHYGQYSLQRAVHLCERLKGKNANNDIGDAQIFYAYH